MTYTQICKRLSILTPRVGKNPEKHFEDPLRNLFFSFRIIFHGFCHRIQRRAFQSLNSLQRPSHFLHSTLSSIRLEKYSSFLSSATIECSSYTNYSLTSLCTLPNNILSPIVDRSHTTFKTNIIRNKVTLTLTSSQVPHQLRSSAGARDGMG